MSETLLERTEMLLRDRRAGKKTARSAVSGKALEISEWLVPPAVCGKPLELTEWIAPPAVSDNPPELTKRRGMEQTGTGNVQI